MPPIGSTAPAFTLPDQTGVDRSLSDYAGQWVLLYFYPKDNTSGCTAEACGFRDVWQQLQEVDCVVLGVSKDSVESHRLFAAEHKLPFPILSDKSGNVVESYDAWDGKGTIRRSYLIRPDGTIAKVYPTVKAQEHATEVLEDLRTLVVS